MLCTHGKNFQAVFDHCGHEWLKEVDFLLYYRTESKRCTKPLGKNFQAVLIHCGREWVKGG